MTAAASANLPQSPRRRPASGGGGLYFMVTLLISGMLMVWVTLLFGGISGSEFSPETLQRRRFEFYQIPLLGLQVTPVNQKPFVGMLEQHLIANKIIQAVNPQRWDLIEGYDGALKVNPRGAAILCSYLDAQNHKNRPYWLDWSNAHPQLAAILWPEVIGVARLRFYELIPDMMQVAKQADESRPADFQAELNRTLINQSLRLAEWWFTVDPDRARALYQLILSKDPQHQRAAEAMQQLPAEKSNAS